MQPKIINDSLLFTVLEPEVPGNPAVVLVDFTVALPPVVKLAGTDTQLFDEKFA